MVKNTTPGGTMNTITITQLLTQPRPTLNAAYRELEAQVEGPDTDESFMAKASHTLATVTIDGERLAVTHDNDASIWAGQQAEAFDVWETLNGSDLVDFPND
jgi:hypothetical protein